MAAKTPTNCPYESRAHEASYNLDRRSAPPFTLKRETHELTLSRSRRFYLVYLVHKAKAAGVHDLYPRLSPQSERTKRLLYIVYTEQITNAQDSEWSYVSDILRGLSFAKLALTLAERYYFDDKGPKADAVLHNSIQLRNRSGNLCLRPRVYQLKRFDYTCRLFF